MNHLPEIPGWDFERADSLSKGLSGDGKFRVEAQGNAYLLRLSQGDPFGEKRREFQRLREISGLGLAVPEPVAFGRCEGSDQVYTLLSWVEGRDPERFCRSSQRPVSMLWAGRRGNCCAGSMTVCPPCRTRTGRPAILP